MFFIFIKFYFLNYINLTALLFLFIIYIYLFIIFFIFYLLHNFLEMLNMVNLLENTQEKWREAINENVRLKQEIKHLEASATPKFLEDTEHEDSFYSTSPSNLYHNERKKRHSSVFLRRSSSLPARNKVILKFFYAI